MKGLFEFIRKSPTAFHAVDTISEMLVKRGFTVLDEGEHWDIVPGGKYYVTRNSSSIIAFEAGENIKLPVFHIAASHCDSPAFKIKENSEITVKDKYVTLDTEGYGGMICYSWLDRPLSVAGRVIIKEKGELVEKHVRIDRDLVLIPSLAIHMNRKVNDGMEFNKQRDTIPLFGMKDGTSPSIKAVLADELGIDESDIFGQDLYLYNRMEPSEWGAEGEYISAPHLDDLMCAYASLEGFIKSINSDVIKLYACFDNEEVGSETRQGAGSSFLEDTIDRISDGLGFSKEDYHRGVSLSLMLSEDNGHAVHPNHPEKTDAVNCVYMNGGIVVKSHAGQKYASDAWGIALCRDICAKNHIPIQYFANRSDEAGGSTLGNIAACRIPIKTVDVGLAQLAMHSAYETAGADDCDYMEEFNRLFFEYR